MSLAIATVGGHLAIAGGYGYQRDELYFIACAQHLSWGYVDQPPLIAVVARIALALFGDSLYGLRALPALAAGGTVLLAGTLARRLGAGLFATVLALVAVALA
ncbi:MAG: glycosyltransferase family 39 protein, partial [Vulcanimicrobiaceae bacterium]